MFAYTCRFLIKCLGHRTMFLRHYSHNHFSSMFRFKITADINLIYYINYQRLKNYRYQRYVNKSDQLTGEDRITSSIWSSWSTIRWATDDVTKYLLLSQSQYRKKQWRNETPPTWVDWKFIAEDGRSFRVVTIMASSKVLYMTELLQGMLKNARPEVTTVIMI